MAWIGRFYKLLYALIPLALVWFFSINSPFQSESSKIEWFKYHERSLEELKLTNQCQGFVGSCEFPTLDIRLEMSFYGLQWKKPFPQFLKISSWGDHRGWMFRSTYYGWRELRVVNSKGAEVARFRQLLWNTGSYASFGQVLAFDLKNRKIYISSRTYGFNAVNEEGWAVRY